jgi:hypothetical protein
MKHKHLFTEIIRLFFGSWYSVIGHTIFFILLLFLYQDLLFFTTFVSIEAIYIGIFILMAEFKEQQERDALEDHRHVKDRQLVKEDVTLTQNVIDEIQAIKKHQHLTSKALEEIREVLLKK